MVSFEDMTEVIAHAIWTQGQDDPDWPLRPGTWPTCQQWLDGMDVARLVGEGQAWAIQTDGNWAGFAVLNTVNDAALPVDERSVECGTYLLPEARGRGLNEAAKTFLIQTSFTQYAANTCLFVIEQANTRARHALTKLPWSFTEDTAISQGPFTAFARRKSWERGIPCVVVWLNSAAYEQHAP